MVLSHESSGSSRTCKRKLDDTDASSLVDDFIEEHFGNQKSESPRLPKKLLSSLPSSPPPPQPPPSSPPETLSNAFWRNGFDLGRVLGFGAFGKVYRARKVSEMEYNFAVKVIQYKNEEVLQEARSEYACNELGSYHKNVVRVESFFEFSLAGTSKQYGVLVLELCHHEDFMDFMENLVKTHRVFDEGIVKYYFRQLLRVLKTLHAAGVFHRDLKPENLLWSRDFKKLKLSDFGLAKMVLGPTALLQGFLGTAAYAAPEVCKSGSDGSFYDPAKADIWSCGVILFVMLTLSLPFDTEEGFKAWYYTAMHPASTLAAGHNKLAADPDGWWCCMSVNRGLSSGATAFLRRMMASQAGQRSSLQELLNDDWLNIDISSEGAVAAYMMAACTSNSS